MTKHQKTGEELRYSKDASVCIVWDWDNGDHRHATQDDMDKMNVGEDLADDELAELDA